MEVGHEGREGHGGLVGGLPVGKVSGVVYRLRFWFVVSFPALGYPSSTCNIGVNWAI